MPKNPLWVEELSKRNKDDAKRLNDMILAVQRHKGVYSLSGDPAVAQLWFAILELSRKQEDFGRVLSGLKAGKTPKVQESQQKRRSEILEALENY